MKLEITSIRDPQVRTFYALWWPQHRILRDFFDRLTEEQFDYRMVDTAHRKSDTARESVVHLLYVQGVYLNGVKTGKLAFGPMDAENGGRLAKGRLLTEWDRIDQETYTYLTSEAFDSQSRIEVPWGGQMNAVDVLFFLRDHDILHIGVFLANVVDESA